MKDFKSSVTGNRIVINCATMREVQRLKQVIFNELKKTPLGIKLTGESTLTLQKDIDFTGIIDYIKDTILGIDTSDEFLDAIYACLQHCTYKTTYRIDEDLFDSDKVPEAREDYYEILYTCIEENLRPFIKSLISTWKTHISIDKITQLLNIM